jgi:O-succinylbenzoic acid--CoA ligase
MTRELREVGVAPGPAGVVAVRDALAEALAGGPAVAPVPVGDETYAARIRAALRPGDPAAPLDRDDVVAVVSTSGSTGDPRGVLLTEANVRTATAALEQRMGGPGDWVASVPMHAVGGLMVAVRALLAGSQLHAEDSVGGATRFEAASFATATATAAEAAEARGVRLYASLVPTQLNRLVAAGEVGLDALRRYDCVLSGAAATPVPLLESLRQNGIAVLASYGMSETCGGCAYDGVPQPGLTFTTDAADGRDTGRIRVTGRAVAAGYRLRPDDPTLHSDADGVGTVVTNDVGSVAADGRVTVLGRTDDVVVVGGTNVALPAVEALLREATGGEACVVARPDAEWGARITAFLAAGDAAVPAPAPTYDDARLAGAVRDRLGRAAVPQAFVRLPELPMLVTGKPDRRALQALADR